MVETQQHKWELERLVDIFHSEAPQTILEIGIYEGGTLRQWLTEAGTTVVGIDDKMRREDEWVEIAFRAGCHLHLISGTSSDPAVIQRAGAFAPFDWVFIDADHRYDAVKADWEHYSPMVEPGGVVAFHDIRNYEHGNVGDLWAELKPWRRTVEIVDLTVDEPWGGIGVLWV